MTDSRGKSRNELVSVVVTIKNEEHNIGDLLDSLIVQEPPIEVLIIDAASTDRSQEIVTGYMDEYPFIKLDIYDAQRGESRNRGIKLAKGDIVSFTDGDCIANPFWIKEIRRSLRDNDIVGGRTIAMGYEAFKNLGRVEVYHKGVDITFPSCNLAYRKHILKEIKGFDPRFVTAEDIDMNFRAVDMGYGIVENRNMVVYHKERSTIVAFYKQAFWNGFGRKQLTMKQGSQWSRYSPSELLDREIGFWWITRTAIGFMGYFSYFLSHSRYRIKGKKVHAS